MRMFKITGKVIGSESKEGIKGLRVEAWDKDFLLNDMAGSAITDEGGTFRIQFDESYFREIVFDRRPDLFFKIFEGETLVKTTEDSVLWNVDREDTNVLLEVEEPGATPALDHPANNYIATRSLLQATYTPRASRQGEHPSKAPRALEKAAFLARLAPTRKELTRIAKKYGKAEKKAATNGDAITGQSLELVTTICKTLTVTGKLDVLRDSRLFVDIDTDTLARIAQDLIQIRKDTSPNTKTEHQQNLLRAFKENMSAECVGYLHLERMSFTPSGIERGELVYSLPLAPGEEVNIKHREWSHITEEFERIVTDYYEEFSEEGVTEKTELAQTIDSETQHSSAFNTGVTASGSYGSVSVTATVGYNASDSDTRSKQLTRDRSADITRKASSRSKKQHKISFRVASAAETEDASVQRINNPYPDKATRIDYYQLIRRWQIDLFRYGIRLTWDMVIPEPGKGLLSKVLELRRIQQKLTVPFESTFALAPEEINFNNYTEVAQQYNVAITEPAPAASIPVSETFPYDWGLAHNVCTSDQPSFQEVLEVEIPEGYEVRPEHPARFFIWTKRCAGGDRKWSITYRDLIAGRTIAHHDHTSEDHVEYTDNKNWPGWNGRSGKVGIHIITWRIEAATVHITIDAAISDKHYRSWQQRVWNSIRDGAKANYYEARKALKDRLAAIEEELGEQDALSLRKKEREEVMKAVLESLGFPPSDARYRDPRIVRFIHHALEWENMLYLLYPYFWSNPDTAAGGNEEQEHPYWEFKKYLDHPDPMHRAFLKAGAARVVLPVRPGFENAYLAFVNTGSIDSLPPSPYLEIGREFEAYAQTNYPGIRAANPVDSFRPLLTRKQQAAWSRMQLLIRLLEIYRDARGSYPSTGNGQDLTVLRELFPFRDPWGNAYQYAFPGQHETGRYDLWSHGADGQPGGTGINADIGNWDAASPKDAPEQVRASLDIELIVQLLEEYRKVHGSYPTTDEGLSPLRALIPLKDPWGNDYDYRCPGKYRDYDLVSFGANGEAGGEGEDADIANWAEASLIGQWFEYTPTSALDIAFDENLPAA